MQIGQRAHRQAREQHLRAQPRLAQVDFLSTSHASDDHAPLRAPLHDLKHHARLGAIHSVVFGGFASKELATRIDDAQPKMILTASCGIEVARLIEYKPLLDRAIDLASHKPAHCIVLQRPQATATLIPGRDLDWADALTRGERAKAYASRSYTVSVR